jgi:folate-binding protein YgfZ
VEGPAATAIVREVSGIDLSDLLDHGHVEAMVHTAAGVVPCGIIRRSLFGLQGAEFLIRRDAVVALWDLLASAAQTRGGAPIGYRAVNMLRLEAGIPWFGADFDDRHIPHEAALEQSHISYIKGCYTGQEIVERVRSRGHVNRRRTGLKFARAEPPPPGSTILSAGTEVGNVTSAASSPQLGCAIGMGYVRRENAQADKLECNGAPAEIIELALGGAATATNC